MDSVWQAANSLIAATALAVSILVARASHRDRLEEQARRARGQARLVTASALGPARQERFEGEETEPTTLTASVSHGRSNIETDWLIQVAIRNGSDADVRDVMAWIRPTEEGRRLYYGAQLPVVKPGETIHNIRARDGLAWLGRPRDPPLVGLEFTDADGRCWHREPTGELKEERTWAELMDRLDRLHATGLKSRRWPRGIWGRPADEPTEPRRGS